MSDQEKEKLKKEILASLCEGDNTVVSDVSVRRSKQVHASPQSKIVDRPKTCFEKDAMQ